MGNAETRAGRGFLRNAMAARVTTILISGTDAAFLERRGARSLRGGGSVFSRSAVLHRALQGYGSLVERSDPRRTRGFPEAFHGAAIELLQAQWELHKLEIEKLGEVLERAQGFGDVLAQRGLDREEFLGAIAGLTFAEKFSLVDAATRLHGPEAGRGDGE